MTKFFVYRKCYKISELVKVMEAKTKEEVLNRYAYLDTGYSDSKLIVSKKLLEGINIENGNYKED